MLLLILTAAAQAGAGPPSPNAQTPAAALLPVTGSCGDARDVDVLICGKRDERYRIDRSVLEASRRAEAPPPKPPLTTDPGPTNGCVGPTACQGDVVPLVGMALVAAKAVALAANGDDWREALRTHEDEYRLYQQAEERRAKDRRPRIGFGASSGK